MKFWVRHSICSFHEFRADLRGLLCAQEVPAEIADELVLATQEACNNAVLHNGAAAELEVAISVFAGQVTIEVADRGGGFDMAAVRKAWPPDVLKGHGRGLFIMDQLTDSLEVIGRKRGTLVRMVKSL